MKYVRMYGDSNGESHFEDVHVDFALGDYSPPTPPVHVSPFAPATQFGQKTRPGAATFREWSEPRTAVWQSSTCPTEA